MVMHRDRVTVVTSQESSDDVLADYVERRLGTAVFRGDLRNVVKRFQSCLAQQPCDWFVRVCGDSPLIDPQLIALMTRAACNESAADVISNVRERTFPPGQSVEIVRTSVFRALDAEALDADDQEHVTRHFYRQRQRYRIRGVHSTDVGVAERRLVVDTLDDLRHVERILQETPELADGYARFAVIEP